MAFPFQVSEVVRPLRIDARRAIAMSLKLQRRVPKGASASARACAEQLHVCTEALTAARHARGSAPGPADNRPLVRTLVNGWSALHGRLAELTKLDPAEVPEAGEAQTLIDALFPEGTGFLKGEHDALWVDSRAALDAIDKGGHAKAVARLAGDYVLRAVRNAHRDCGVALGLTSPGASAAAAGVELKPVLDAVTAAIAAYALQLVAGTDPDDAAAVRDVAHALDPVVQHRKRTKTRAAADVPVDANAQTEGNAPSPGVVPAGAPAANDNPANDAAPKGRRVA